MNEEHEDLNTSEKKWNTWENTGTTTEMTWKDKEKSMNDIDNETKEKIYATTWEHTNKIANEKTHMNEHHRRNNSSI